MIDSARLLQQAIPEEKEEQPQDEEQAVEDTAYFALRQRVSPEKLLGVLAHAAGLIPAPTPISAKELAGEFSWEKLKGAELLLDPSLFV